MDIKSADLNNTQKLHTNKSQQDQTKKPPLKKGPRAQIWHLIIGGIAALVFLIWVGDHYLAPNEFEFAKTKADVALAAKCSEQAGPTGDLSKVNSADRQAFLSMLSGAPVDPRTVLVRVWKSKHLSAQEKTQSFWHRLGNRLHWFP
jgi:hypothetical protein